VERPLPNLQNGEINGMFCTMKTTIDAAGRLVIPKELRREARLRPGTELEIRWREGLIEIEPVPLPVKMKKRGRFLVAMPDQPIEQLTSETVERTRQQLTRNRAASS
jgi:AbrB family looped-hinge helix DNA binding protein